MGKNSFLKGAFILGIAGVIVNLLGAIFRIPLGNIIGSEGMGYYQSVFPIYILLLTISASGFPTAISKLVSEKIALQDFKGANKIFKVSFFVLFFIGLIFFLILFLGANYIVNNYSKNPKAYYSMLAISPALLLVPVMSTFRGYFQGRQEMSPIAVSQIMEQFGRVTIGLYLALIFLPKGREFASAGASFGATVGAVFGTIYIIFIYIKNKSRIKSELEISKNFKEDSTKQIINKLLLIAIPITIGTSILPIMNMIDSGIVVRRLQDVGYTYKEANNLYGQLSGMAGTLINFPYTITMALAISLVPVISHFYTIKDIENLKKNIKTGIRTALLIGLPASFGLAALSTPIMKMVYPKEPASVGYMLLILSMSVVFIGLNQALTAVFQGIEKPHIPVVNLGIGALFKIIISYILMAVPYLNVKGAAIGSVVSFIIIAILNFYYVKKYMNIKFEFVYYIAKPLLSVSIMTALVIITYKILLGILGNSVACIISIIVGGFGYGFALITTGSISEEEILMMPKGEKLNKILNRFRN
ncbi:putative polysaccharide biosynthesis protein [Tepidibacter formicigenes]|uniref:Stage V sporulation protein B n=1 Tax=Tepidibacter formicigenes DSM 15518 TaxID=1123349 RepID=A0A1M6NSY4_9FIRM|nr:polysaccharide biosynthesis protein [Tepidibacter formicigenes]SHJ98748.1 stage V sporulation protein B [Tepidibacter formicigenes DSM 15518]